MPYVTSVQVLEKMRTQLTVILGSQVAVKSPCIAFLSFVSISAADLVISWVFLEVYFLSNAVSYKREETKNVVEVYFSIYFLHLNFN